MNNCGTCRHFTLQFPTGFPAYYVTAQVGRCELDPLWKIRAPNSGKDCKKHDLKEQK